MDKFWMQFKQYKLYIIGVLLVFITTYLVGLYDIELPGVYFDAVYPDYLASIGAFPGVNNFTQITQHVGLPLLGNFYHGTFSAAVQFVVLKCVGHASVYTLRLTNLFYVAVIGAILFVDSYKISKKWLCSLLCTFFCVTSQNALSHIRTQYYIMLPGVVFFLLSMSIILWNTRIKEESKQSWFVVAGIFQGLAFYNYFSFLFLAPVSLILIFKHECISKRKESSFCYIWSVVLGSILYFYGYLDSLLVNLFGFSVFTKALLVLGCIIITLALCIPILTFLNPRFKRYRRNVFAIYTITALMGTVIMSIIFIKYIGINKFDAISKMLVMSQNRNSGNRLLQFWNLLYLVVTNNCGQLLIFRKTIDDFGWGHIIICICLTVTAFLLCNYRRKFRYKEVFNRIEIAVLYDLCIYIVVFYVTSLPIVTGMQPQHLVVAYYIVSFISMMGVCYIIHFFDKYVRMGLIVSLLIVGIVINTKNDSMFFEMLEKTGGRDAFSSAYNDFSKMAYEDQNKDMKIYIFPQWKFYPNFVYLTSNSCQAIRNEDIQIRDIQQKIDDGYTVVVTATNIEIINDISEQLTYGTSVQNSWKSFEGDEVFISIEICN